MKLRATHFQHSSETNSKIIKASDEEGSRVQLDGQGHQFHQLDILANVVRLMNHLLPVSGVVHHTQFICLQVNIKKFDSEECSRNTHCFKQNWAEHS